MNLFAEGNVTAVNALMVHVPIVKPAVSKRGQLGERGGRVGRKENFSLGVSQMPAYSQRNIFNQTLVEDVTSKRRDQQICCKLVMCPYNTDCFLKIGKTFFPFLPSPSRNSSEISGSHWSTV